MRGQSDFERRLTRLLRDVEGVEDALAAADGLDEADVEALRRTVTDIRADLGDALIEREHKSQRLKRELDSVTNRPQPCRRQQ